MVISYSRIEVRECVSMSRVEGRKGKQNEEKKEKEKMGKKHNS